MPANTFDHRQLASESGSDFAFAFATAQLLANPSLDVAAPGGVTYTAGAGLGTTPPAATIAAGSNALRGRITFGTGSSTPAGGTAFTITFPVAIAVANAAVTAFPWVQPGNQATSAFAWAVAPVVAQSTVTGLVVTTSSTLTASQAATVYILDWHVQV